MLLKIGALKKLVTFTRKHLCWSLFLKQLQGWRPVILLKRTPTQVFLCEYCKIFQSNLFCRTLLVTHSNFSKFKDCFKDTHSKNTPVSNKTQALTKTINNDVWVPGILNQLFKIASYPQIKFSKKWPS